MSSPTPYSKRQAKKRAKEPFWALVRTKTGQERYAARNCEAQGFTVYAPRWQPVLNKGTLKPFFPGYIFVRMDAGRSWQPLRNTFGVIDIVGGSEGPWPVPPREFKRLHQMEDDEGILRTPEQLEAMALAIKQKRKLIKGETVRFIGNSAYKNQAAVYKGLTPSGRITVMLSIMGRRVPKDVERSEVAPVG